MPSTGPETGPEAAPETRIWLVGAGPGDPDLLTVKAQRLIFAADIVLYDALVTAEILALARKAELIPVGKRAGAHSMPQAAINAMLVAAARRGGKVVRLKGGDPTLFGRLCEEMDALRRANLRFEVVPGITAACAAAAAGQISLTRRGCAQGVTFVTGHAETGKPLALDWSALADPTRTLAIYMGKSAAAGLRQQLLTHGMAPDTPIFMAENVGRSDQTSWSAKLSDLDRIAAKAGHGPVITLIGLAVDGRSGPGTAAFQPDNLKIGAKPKIADATRNGSVTSQ